MTLSIGQVLWCVPSARHFGIAREVVVTKVGRKWAEIANNDDARCQSGRVAIEGLVVDGGGFSSPGRCYVDRATYERGRDRDAAWHAFRTEMRDHFNAPEHLTADDIRRAREILRGVGE